MLVFLKQQKLLEIFICNAAALWKKDVFSQGKKSFNKLQVVQNTFLKIIYGMNRLTSTIWLHKNYGFLLVKDLIYSRQCVLMYDILNNKNNEYIKLSKVCLINSIHNYPTRNNSNIYQEKYSFYNNKKVISSCTKAFNLLPNDIKSIKSCDLFKTHLDKAILDKY